MQRAQLVFMGADALQIVGAQQPPLVKLDTLQWRVIHRHSFWGVISQQLAVFRCPSAARADY